MKALDWRAWTLDWRAFGSGLAWGLLPVVQAIIVTLVALVVAAVLGLTPADDELGGQIAAHCGVALAFLFTGQLLWDHAGRFPARYASFAFGVYAVNDLASAIIALAIDMDAYFPDTTTRMSDLVYDLAWRPALVAMMVAIHRQKIRGMTSPAPDATQG